MANPVGRPDKFTPERRAAILNSISHRIPYELAAEANGIVESTLYEWIAHGRVDMDAGIDSEYARFSEAIKDTEQKKIMHHLEKIDANVDRWQADAWILERRWWKYYGTNSAVIEFNKRLEHLEQEGKTQSVSLNHPEPQTDKDITHG